MKIGEIIKKYRDEHGYSLREFSRISGVSNSYLSMLESGRLTSLSGRSFSIMFGIWFRRQKAAPK